MFLKQKTNQTAKSNKSVLTDLSYEQHLATGRSHSVWDSGLLPKRRTASFKAPAEFARPPSVDLSVVWKWPLCDLLLRCAVQGQSICIFITMQSYLHLFKSHWPQEHQQLLTEDMLLTVFLTRWNWISIVPHPGPSQAICAYMCMNCFAELGSSK